MSGRWVAPLAFAIALHAALAVIPLPSRVASEDEKTRVQIAAVTAAEPAKPASVPETSDPIAPPPVRTPSIARPPPTTHTPTLGPPEVESSPRNDARDLPGVTPTLPPMPPAARPPMAPRPRNGAPDLSELRRYAALVRARMHGEKRYPPRALRRRVEGQATVRVRIAASGALAAAPEIEESSGSDDLDREVLRMARAAAPYPPPPQDLPRGPVAVVVPVRFTSGDAP